VVETFQAELNLSHGQYPERSVSQLQDFLSTIITVTNMEEDDFEQIQKEKVQLLSEYRDEIDELFKTADSLHQRALEDWGEMFRSQVDDELWTDEWHLRDDKCGRIFKDGWYLDSNLEPTTNPDEAWGDNAMRLHFVHYIREKQSFRQGKLRFKLRTNSLNSVDVRDEFHRLYDSGRWEDELQPLLDSRQITNEGKKKVLIKKTYDVDQFGLPESYFETLAVAFEEYLPAVEVIDEILDEAVANVKGN